MDNIERDVTEIGREDVGQEYICYEGNDPSFDSRQGQYFSLLRNVQTDTEASYSLGTGGTFSGSNIGQVEDEGSTSSETSGRRFTAVRTPLDVIVG